MPTCPSRHNLTCTMEKRTHTYG